MSLNGISSNFTQQQSVRAHSDGDLPPPKTQGVSDTVLAALTRFIPTEVLAPFLAVLSVAQNAQWDARSVYLWFVVGTPFAFLLIHLAQLASNNQPWPVAHAIPLLMWKAVAATIAFAVWALVAPTNPLQNAIGGAAVAAVLSVIISPALTALDLVVVRVLSPNHITP